jgi:thiol:disulfide interchange protein DsbC
MKKAIVSAALLMAAFILPRHASAFGTGAQGCSGDCTACHSLTKEEAVSIFQKIDPSMTVTDVGRAPASGLYQVSVKKEGQSGVVYVDFGKKHLIVGNIIDIGTRSDLTQKGIETSMRVDVAKIPLKDALVMGNRKGTKKIYVFSDPECPFCGKLHAELEQLAKEEPQLKIYVILNPLEIHPNSGWKSDSIVCASKKGMSDAVKMLADSFAGKEVKKVACGNRYSDEARKMVKSLGLNMTPLTVFADGKVTMGYKTKEELKKELAKHP